MQQWVVKFLSAKFKSLEEGDVRSTSMGAPGEDILLSPAARKLIPFSIECKNLSSMTFYKWYEQAKANAPRGTEPIVVAKANHKNPVVIVDAEWFFNHYTVKKTRSRK